MEGEKNNCSTFFVPGGMSDVTILNTPMPRAASTATKRKSLMEEENKMMSHSETFHKEFNEFCQMNSSNDYAKLPGSEDIEKLMKIPECKINQNIEPVLQPNNLVLNNRDYDTCIPHDPMPIFSFPGSVKSSDSFYSSAVKTSSVVATIKNSSGKITNNNSVMNMDKIKLRSPESEIVRKPFEGPITKGTNTSLLRFKTTEDLSQERNDRVSSTSSANSSLGVIHPEVLEGAFKQPIVDFNQDLSLRLAEKLNLDTSLVKNGVEISTLASERYKDKVAAQYEDKENKRVSGRRSSDYWTIHGYSSDNSDSKNNTAKRLSTLSTGSGAESDSRSSSKHSMRPLSEINLTSNSRLRLSSMGSNPFGDYTNASVGSNDFQFGEDAVQRLESDERQFSLASTGSLSGIYGDTDVSVNINGEKLSVSSYMRGGSYPLGSLETGHKDSQSPQFGMPSQSPEKTGVPKAILPPPQENPTFVVDEEPVRDNPWTPHSLMEQYSNIHNTSLDLTDADTSVPSLSYISVMLDRLQHGANPKDIMAQLMASKSNTKNKPDTSFKANRISSIVEGENSFCQGIEVEGDRGDGSKPGHQLPSSDALLDVSICNITDFEGDNDACVCIMTPQSMDFDIFNELTHPVEYSFAKACYMDGQRKDAAAFVHFPVSKLMLYPGQKRTLTINIAALAPGEIKIKIEVARKNPLTKLRESTYVYGKIIAEMPKISLLTSAQCEMIHNLDCEFDGKYTHIIVLKNEGRSTVPLKLSVTKISDDDVEFNFGGRGKLCITVMVEPGQKCRQVVQCETPPVYRHLQPPEKNSLVKAKVEVSLATTDLNQLNLIAPVTLVAPLKPYFFGAPPLLLVPAILSLYNGWNIPVSFKTVTASGFVVIPPTFTIPANGTFVVTVATAETKTCQRCGNLVLHASYPEGQHSCFTIQLRDEQQLSFSSNNSLATPVSSRATSPTSPSSITRAPVGELKVACSHKQLVWGGCHLHQRVVKSFCLKNTGLQREKLRLTVSDPSFKIVGDEDTLKSEMKLSLQPMENKEMKLAVLATVAGPQWGFLTISRISCATDKNVLPLYAFGGKPKVNLPRGIFEIEANKYLFLDDSSLESSFDLQNSGDSSAFFRISEANSKSSVGLSISPQEGLLSAGCTMTVQVALSVTSERLELLLRQTGMSVCVAQLSVMCGDESTRQRLLRIRGLSGVLAARISHISQIHSTPINNLNKLDGSMKGAEKLWEEDTDDWTVRVFINRVALEALRLDTSEDYVNLSTTITSNQ